MSHSGDPKAAEPPSLLADDNRMWERDQTTKITDYALVAGFPSQTPVDVCWAAVDGGRMRYLRCGSGPPLLLIHGLLGYSFSWRFNLDALAPHFTVYAPDLLGTGFSDRSPTLDCSSRASARRVLQMMDAAGIGSCDLLGTSHGGGVALSLAAMGIESGQQRVERLVLVAPINPWSSYGRLLTRTFATKPGALGLRGIFPLLRRMRYFVLARLYADRNRIAPGSVEGYARGATLPGTLDYLCGVMRCWHPDLIRLERDYHAIADVPTLLVWGSRDPAVLPQSAQRVHQILRRSRLVMMEGVGHLPYEESPQQFNRILLDYLR